MKEAASAHLSLSAYQQLAQFRHHIREFLQFSEQAARSHGIEPQQHQLLLAIKGLPGNIRPTISALSARLCLRHHSTVELVNRLEESGAVARRPSEEDRREVLIGLTPQGEQILQQFSPIHRQELQTTGPALLEALEQIVKQTNTNNQNQHEEKI